MKKLAIVLPVFIALCLAGIGVTSVIREIRAYQALKVEHAAILKYLGEPIASQKGKDGADEPLNRAIVLDFILQETLKQAATPAPPVK